jgi:8-oxo-dGTP pyrophosphatase MutT (NUDIX family)
MHRNKILTLFKRYRVRYPQEAVVVERICSFVDANTDCFSRELPVGHITGSAWILDTTGTRALLTHHKKLDIWVQLGGHADGDPDIEQVAYREAIEESGLAGLEFVDQELFDIDIHQIPARGHEAAHYHYDCRFLFRAVDDHYTVSDESHDLLWVPLDDMCSVTTEASITRMVEKTQILMRASSSEGKSG